MSSEDPRIERLERQMRIVYERLGLPTAEPAVPQTEPENPAPAGADDVKGVSGDIDYSGSFERSGSRFKFRQKVSLRDAIEILETEPEQIARVYAALGAPFRLHVLRALLEGPRTSQELQATLDVGPVGQLYHHLRELLATGLISQPKRGVYELRQGQVMPVLVLLSAAPSLSAQRRSQFIEPDQAEDAAGESQPG